MQKQGKILIVDDNECRSGYGGDLCHSLCGYGEGGACNKRGSDRLYPETVGVGEAAVHGGFGCGAAKEPPRSFAT